MLVSDVRGDRVFDRVEQILSTNDVLFSSLYVASWTPSTRQPGESRESETVAFGLNGARVAGFAGGLRDTASVPTVRAGLYSFLSRSDLEPLCAAGDRVVKC
mmetsp:Transcript_10391/g.34667  ORF Transcript_10391/g.34667 Transcript_10391/m.34667 type:complete len:102 (+) Transcript_10391:398-703(+)